jgi:hypothetical protein
MLPTRQTGAIRFAAVVEVVGARIQGIGADLQPQIRIAEQVVRYGLT